LDGKALLGHHRDSQRGHRGQRGHDEDDAVNSSFLSANVSFSSSVSALLLLFLLVLLLLLLLLLVLLVPLFLFLSLPLRVLHLVERLIVTEVGG
jgi:hypothetical protein